MMTLTIDDCIDRGVELNQLREQRTLTDVVLVCGGREVHAHKLILSLHSYYFRTLFKTEGFDESVSEKVEVSSLSFDVIEALVVFMYSGRFCMADNSGDPAELAVELLRAETFLQLSGSKLRTSLENILIKDLSDNCSLENLLRHWNNAALYSLTNLYSAVQALLNRKLESWAMDVNNVPLLTMLGFEDMEEMLGRPGLCVRSDYTLLSLLLEWTRENMFDSADYPSLAKLLSLLHLERSVIITSLQKILPDFAASLLPAKNPARRGPCPRFSYLVEAKPSKTQLRNIEDFVDKGEKSSFLSLSPNGMARVPEMGSNSSMAGTCNGNYFRPVTQGSFVFVRNAKLYVVGGLKDPVIDGAGVAAARRKAFRKDALVFDTKQQSWQPPVKGFLNPSKKYKNLSVESISKSESHCYFLLRGEDDNREGIIYIDQIQLAQLDSSVRTKPVQSFLTNLPNWFNSTLGFCTDLKSRLYVCGGTSFGRFNLDTESWERLQKPIGDLGASSRPWLAGHPDLVFLLTGKPEQSNAAVTNLIQVYEVGKSTWRLLTDLKLRFSPTFFGLHDNQLIVAGWCPARRNFLMLVNTEDGAVRFLHSNIDNIFSSGVIVHDDEVPGLIL